MGEYNNPVEWVHLKVPAAYGIIPVGRNDEKPIGHDESPRRCELRGLSLSFGGETWPQASCRLFIAV